MNRELRKRFPPFVDENSLRSAIESVCAELGAVTSLKILPASRYESLQCACFLRLDSAAAEAKLKAKYEVSDVGSDFVFFADVDEAWTGETG